MEYREFCEGLAREAGAIMRSRFSHLDAIRYEEDASPVTVVDEKINGLVIESVKKTYPGHDIHGEEEDSLENGGEYLRVCDPLDGTIPFTRNIPTVR